MNNIQTINLIASPAFSLIKEVKNDRSGMTEMKDLLGPSFMISFRHRSSTMLQV